MNGLFLVLAIFVSWLWVPSVRPLCAADVYQGQVVDEETGQPLVGAAVTVVWFRSPIVQLAGSKFFQNAQEAVTDNEGKFSLLVSPGIDWSPFTYAIKEPTVIVFRPGYDPLRGAWIAQLGFRYMSDFLAALKKGVVLNLAKLKTQKRVTILC